MQNCRSGPHSGVAAEGASVVASHHVYEMVSEVPR